MNDIAHQISVIPNTTFHQVSQSRESVSSFTDSQSENKKRSHKYLLENNVIVYEKYDRYGKLISRVPWSHKPIDKKA